MGPSTVGAVALLALFFDVADGAYGLRRASVQSPVSAPRLLPTGGRARPGGSREGVALLTAGRESASPLVLAPFFD